MRIAVRHQLSLLLVLSSAIGLAVLAIATWCTNHGFVLRVARDGLETAVSLKAVEVAVSLDLMYTACVYITTGGSLQQALKRYNNGSNVDSWNWDDAAADLGAALNTAYSSRHSPGVQAQLRARNESGPDGNRSVLNVTGAGEAFLLPWRDSNGNVVHLGEGSLGYPPGLYPNLTISGRQDDVSSGTYVAKYGAQTLGLHSNLVLGPLLINNSFSLLSMTVPVVDNYSETNILGWLTVVQTTKLIQQVIDDYTGLGNTGMTSLFGPTGNDNLFTHDGVPAGERDISFVVPVRPSSTTSNCPSCTTTDLSFTASAYPGVESAISTGFHGTQDLGSLPNTHNELGQKVSIAYATPPTELVDWIIVVEQASSEFWDPVDQLRTIILACFFSVLGFFFFASLPIAHWAVKPITRLRAATESTIDPLYRSSSGSLDRFEDSGEPQETTTGTRKHRLTSAVLAWWRGKDRTTSTVDREQRRFRIPSKVDTSKHWVKDDLSDLMDTFNEMSDELFLQYSKLEERVQQRTIELEQSKKAAEAANESKTLFVANVSHELKTPLNGILGMCATSIEEDDREQMKTSLSIIYKSGDLLLRTLNDLLDFSINQVGIREMILEEREFSLCDVETQVVTIFEKQAAEKGIKLRFVCDDVSPDVGGAATGLKQVALWGDVHRILQIIINLVSNSLKYTPEGGAITVVVRRSIDTAPRRLSLWQEQLSMQSWKSRKSRSTRTRRSAVGATANFINPTEGYRLQEKTLAPPGNDFFVEFEVQDTGQGIPEELQSRIFEPFVQGEGGLNRRHSGTGLGLSICNQLATLMRGNIALKSTVGQGSTFNVKLPLRQVMSTPTTNHSLDIPLGVALLASSTNTEKHDEKSSEKDIYEISDHIALPPESKRIPLERGTPLSSIPGSPNEPEVLKNDTSADPSSAPEGQDPRASTPVALPAKKSRKSSKDDKTTTQHDFSKLRVLVAEDNKVNQQVILRMLKMEQILQVTIAEDGKQALDRVKESQASDSADNRPYDLIFMDIQMPIMDGLTSTRMIRESGFQGPVVALTAYAEKKNVEDCHECGMNHFLAKPLRKPQLHEALTKLCSTGVEPPTSENAVVPLLNEAQEG